MGESISPLSQAKKAFDRAFKAFLKSDAIPEAERGLWKLHTFHTQEASVVFRREIEGKEHTKSFTVYMPQLEMTELVGFKHHVNAQVERFGFRGFDVRVHLPQGVYEKLLQGDEQAYQLIVRKIIAIAEDKKPEGAPPLFHSVDEREFADRVIERTFRQKGVRETLFPEEQSRWVEHLTFKEVRQTEEYAEAIRGEQKFKPAAIAFSRRLDGMVAEELRASGHNHELTNISLRLLKNVPEAEAPGVYRVPRVAEVILHEIVDAIGDLKHENRPSRKKEITKTEKDKAAWLRDLQALEKKALDTKLTLDEIALEIRGSEQEAPLTGEAVRMRLERAKEYLVEQLQRPDIAEKYPSLAKLAREAADRKETGR